MNKSNKDDGSPYIKIVKSILTGLAKIRMDSGGWEDSESEAPDRETKAFKIGESLRPFYLAANDPHLEMEESPLPDEVLLGDTRQFLRHVTNDGFFPSPYSQVPGGTDQYTDFAAFTLDFCLNAYDYWLPRKAGALINSIKAVARHAFEFLTATTTYLRDDRGCRWAGTNEHRRKGKEEVYTDTYFTSIVLIALHHAVAHPVLGLHQKKQFEVQQLLKDAGRWIASRFDKEYITGDESKTNRKLIYSTWGVRALSETYAFQEKSVMNAMPAIAEAYLTALRGRITDGVFSVQQEFLTVVSQEYAVPLYYDDRSEIGGVLTSLASLRRVTDIEDLIAKLNYNFLLEQVINAAMLRRNNATGVWNNSGLILSLHSYLTEAFLQLARKGQYISPIPITAQMLRLALRDTFADPSIVATFHDAVYQRVLRQVEIAANQKIVEESLTLEPPSETQHGQTTDTKRTNQKKRTSKREKKQLPSPEVDS